MRSINPATLEVISAKEELTDGGLEQKLSIAQNAFDQWKTTSFEQRSSLMKDLSNYLTHQKSEIARIITSEVGKTLSASEAEIGKSVLAIDYYLQNAPQFLKPEFIQTDASESYVRFDPMGIILAIMPWNFPFWQVFRFAAPALMAGNVGILKHASNVQLSAEAIEKAFIESGFPEGVFVNLAISSGRVAKVIRDPRVKAVTLTGSEKAGSEVAKIAGSEIKKTVLELGGSDPFIVLEDANIPLAVEAAVSARMQNNVGQSCIAAKRFIIHKKIADNFIVKLKQVLGKLVIGDPVDPKTNIGPLATKQILVTVDSQVMNSVEKGAHLISGGKRKLKEGYFYEPTILDNVKPGMPVYDEEVFGPVFSIITVKNVAEAIDTANDSAYGLGATIFTKDIKNAQKISSRIESGSVFINNLVKSDPRLPFGGIKKSGYGRELSHYGIKEFVNIKTVWVK